MSSPPNSVLSLCKGDTGGVVGRGDVTLASSGADGACDSQFKLKEGAYVIVVEGSAGVGRRWVAERIWVMEATEPSHGVGGWGGSL